MHFLSQQISGDFVVLSPNYLRQPTASTAHGPLPDWEREAGGPELFVVNGQCVILGQLSNVISAMRQLWLSRSVKKGCCYAEGEDTTSHRSNTIDFAPNTAKLMHTAARVCQRQRETSIIVCPALASLKLHTKYIAIYIRCISMYVTKGRVKSTVELRYLR